MMKLIKSEHNYKIFKGNEGMVKYVLQMTHKCGHQQEWFYESLDFLEKMIPKLENTKCVDCRWIDWQEENLPKK